MSSPIADLSYRNYDGPLESTRLRWWVIARTGIRQAFSKKVYWVATAFSSWYYLVMIAVLFFVQQFAESNPQGGMIMTSFLSRIVWKDQFLHGFSYAQLIILLTALLLGAGSIANDNRANALLVYLSKPCDKRDYVIGKWVGIFLPLLLMMSIPSVVFYLYGALTFTDHGFLSADPWLIVKVLLMLPLSAALHASLVLAISSLFSQGRIAGAAYAGVYFLTNFFTVLMKFSWVISRGHAPPIVKSLSYCSIDGIQIGLAKSILGTAGSNPFAMPMSPQSAPPIPAPPLIPFLAIVALIMAFCTWFTWRQVRAVEVVG